MFCNTVYIDFGAPMCLQFAFEKNTENERKIIFRFVRREYMCLFETEIFREV